ncbi:hypothetical protein NX10_25855 [Pseudomonas fluorescens]|nr:hypothetical protein NX10_25855 [Pseudomonas fluorescens]
MGWLCGRYREQAHSYSLIERVQQKRGRLPGRLREQARFHKIKNQKQSSAAARGEAAPLNNERKLECS